MLKAVDMVNFTNTKIGQFSFEKVVIAFSGPKCLYMNMNDKNKVRGGEGG